MRLGMFMMPVHPPDRTFWSTLDEDTEKSLLADQLGDHERAQGFYHAALKIAPGEPSVLSNLGLSYALSKKLPAAEQTLRQAAGHSQADERVRQNLALVLALHSRNPAIGAAELEQVAHGMEIELKRVPGTRDVVTTGGPGRAVMIASDEQPDPFLTIKDYPGHTPGSIAINLKDGGKQATFSGDIMHHPIQVYYPEWSSQFCWDQEMSARSRRKLLEDCVESNALLCPAHFPGANAGHIKPQGDAFKIEWDVVK